MIDGRPAMSGVSFRRRRRCQCGHSWTTYEFNATDLPRACFEAGHNSENGALFNLPKDAIATASAKPKLLERAVENFVQELQRIPA